MTGSKVSNYIALNSSGRPVGATRGRYRIVINPGDQTEEIGHVDLIGNLAVRMFVEVKTKFRGFIVGPEAQPNLPRPAIYIADSDGKYCEELTGQLLGKAGSSVEVTSVDAPPTGGVLPYPRSA